MVPNETDTRANETDTRAAPGASSNATIGAGSADEACNKIEVISEVNKVFFIQDGISLYTAFNAHFCKRVAGDDERSPRV